MKVRFKSDPLRVYTLKRVETGVLGEQDLWMMRLNLYQVGG